MIASVLVCAVCVCVCLRVNWHVNSKWIPGFYNRSLMDLFVLMTSLWYWWFNMYSFCLNIFLLCASSQVFRSKVDCDPGSPVHQPRSGSASPLHHGAATLGRNACSKVDCPNQLSSLELWPKILFNNTFFLLSFAPCGPAEPPTGGQQHRQLTQEPGCDAAGHRDQETAGSAAERWVTWTLSELCLWKNLFPLFCLNNWMSQGYAETLTSWFNNGSQPMFLGKSLK